MGMATSEVDAAKTPSALSSGEEIDDAEARERILKESGLTVLPAPAPPLPLTPAPAHRVGSVRGKQVKVRERRDGRWGKWKYFTSLIDAAKGFGVSLWFQYSPKIQVVLDEDTNLEGENWAVHTKDMQVSHYGRVWDVRTGRKYFPQPESLCCGEYIHRLVAKYHLAPPADTCRWCVDHIDATPSSWYNAAFNLQYVTVA